MLLLGLVEVPVWLLITVVILITFILYVTRDNDYWSKQGVPGPKPLPLIGTMLPFLTKTNFVMDEMYMKKYGNVVGTFEGTLPVLLVKDVEFLKNIFVKEHKDYFTNRRSFKTNDSVLDKMMTALVDDDWARVRHLLTPTFSAGKLKQMIHQMNRCAKSLVENVAENKEQFEVKEFTGCYTMDVIASTNFGLEVNTQKDKDSQFMRMAKKAFDSGGAVMIKFFIFLVIPGSMKILRKFGIQLFPLDAFKYFETIVDQVMESRGENKGGHADFMQLMVNAHKEKVEEDATEDESAPGDTVSIQEIRASQKQGLSKEEIIAQGVIFLLAGYDTTAITLAFLMYNLALNPDCQEKLHQEICQVLGDKEEVTYNQLSEMVYLDMCISESLRMFPPAVRTERAVKADVTMNGVFLRKDMVVGVPIWDIHYDPEIYPDPHQFNPERFTAEAKAERSPFHYLAFGYGPRSCIGMRLALVELKVGAVHLIKKLKFLKSEKTQVPMQFRTSNLLRAKNGIWLKVESR